MFQLFSGEIAHDVTKELCCADFMSVGFDERLLCSVANFVLPLFVYIT